MTSFQGCESLQFDENGIAVDGNMFVLKNFEFLHSVLTEVNNGPIEEYDFWLESFGINTIYGDYSNALEGEYQLFENLDESSFNESEFNIALNNWKISHQDYTIIDQEYNLYPVLDIVGMDAILNRNGEFRVCDQYFLFTNSLRFQTDVSNLNTINYIRYNKENNWKLGYNEEFDLLVSDVYGSMQKSNTEKATLGYRETCLTQCGLWNNEDKKIVGDYTVESRQYNDDAQAGDDISDPLFFFNHFILVRAERRRGWPSNGWRAEKRHIGLSYDIQGTHRIGNNIEGWRQFPHSFFEADACAYTKELRLMESVVFRPLRFWGFLGNTTEMIVENSNTNIEYTNRLGNCETLDAQCSEIFSNGTVTSGSTFDPVTNTWGNLIRPPTSFNWCND